MPKNCTVNNFAENFSLTHVGILQATGLHMLEDPETGVRELYMTDPDAKGDPEAFKYKNTALVFVRNYNPLVDSGFYK